jgi:hypothetical protein
MKMKNGDNGWKILIVCEAEEEVNIDEGKELGSSTKR